MNIDAIRAAAERTRGHVRRTPMLSSPALDALAGRRVLVTAECLLQHARSLKARGDWAAVSALAPEVRARGVTAYSSGNHGQGVTRASALHGVPAVIVMPADAPRQDRGHSGPRWSFTIGRQRIATPSARGWRRRGG